jgi:DUF1707 SHOCT-like domain
MPQSYSQQEPRDRSLRAGDRDRDRDSVADILREQHLAGRLQSDEFQERLDRCYGAKRYEELDELVADLPAEEPTRSAPRPWRFPALVLLPVLIAAVALSGGRLLWLAIPLFFFIGRPLLWRSAGRRFGWGFVACGARQSPPPGSYI